MADADKLNIDSVIARLLEGWLNIRWNWFGVGPFFSLQSELIANVIGTTILHILYDLCFYLCSVRGSKPGKNVQLTDNEIRGLCLKSREIFLSQPILLELEAPLKVCGTFSMVICLHIIHFRLKFE